MRVQLPNLKDLTQRDRTLLGVIVVVLLIMAFGLLGRMTLQDAVLEQNTYCENVKANVWPDYRGDYKQICKQG